MRGRPQTEWNGGTWVVHACLPDLSHKPVMVWPDVSDSDLNKPELAQISCEQEWTAQVSSFHVAREPDEHVWVFFAIWKVSAHVRVVYLSCVERREKKDQTFAHFTPLWELRNIRKVCIRCSDGAHRLLKTDGSIMSKLQHRPHRLQRDWHSGTAGGAQR